ncbi:AraC family transcriptional regulator [Intestinibacillus massiliensis]|uniref:helix-turn-helix domain-containing protein n=1 Tax=Intestinibacillus massiliensis TaxID=1871029 RepID=UPI000B351B01|nr:AraC family transcriptional regulator [Intestinibacillus massiliensis]MCB6365789.1 AraC family transcriptional regulator [Intestinibacillus massiliensis]
MVGHEEIVSCFEGGRLPQLLYATRQEEKTTNMTRPMHGHNNIAEVLLVYGGSGQYMVGNKTYEIATGDLLLYNAGDLHEVSTPSGTAISTYSFGLTDLHLVGLPENHVAAPDTPFVRQTGSRYDTFNNLATMIYRELAEDKPLAAELCRLLMSAMLVLTLQLPVHPEHTAGKADYTLANRIKDYIDAHYTEYITLGTIAKALRISPYYAAHTFKEIMGYSPIQYVIRRRIGEAQSLLINSDYSATQIATMVGYDNTNYFSTIFTKTVGQSPIRYRKQFLENMQGERIQ